MDEGDGQNHCREYEAAEPQPNRPRRRSRPRNRKRASVENENEDDDEQENFPSRSKLFFWIGVRRNGEGTLIYANLH